MRIFFSWGVGQDIVYKTSSTSLVLAQNQEIPGNLLDSYLFIRVKSTQVEVQNLKMASPFYNYTIATLTRGLNTLSILLKKAEEYAKENNIPVDELLNARLVEDMKPLSFQIATATNSASKALARVASIESPPQQELDTTYEDLYKRLDRTLAELEKVDPAKIASKEGQTFKAPIGPKVIDFTPESYSVRFLIPNFYFHVVTAYAILRAKGVPIGKMDYLSDYLSEFMA